MIVKIIKAFACLMVAEGLVRLMEKKVIDEPKKVFKCPPHEEYDIPGDWYGASICKKCGAMWHVGGLS